MLPKINRLTKKNDFDVVFVHGKAFKSDFLIFKYLKNNLNTVRVGFVVSKKVSNKATIRNKVKRKLRAAFLKNTPIKSKSLDVIVLALPNSQNKNFNEVQEATERFFKII